MKTLVLGATGFIGGHIAKAALAEGWEVRGLRRNPNATGHLDEKTVEWVTGDIRDAASLEKAMEGVEVAFHCAAYYPKRGDRRSVREQVDEAMAEISGILFASRQANANRFIYTSTLTTIGHPPPDEVRLADERDFYQPGSLAKSAYYEAKYAMERAVLEAAREGFPAVVLNPTAVFGPGDVHLTLGGILIAIARGRVPGWLPGEVNAVDVRDVAAAQVEAAKAGRPGERYIVGGHNMSIRELITRAATVAGAKAPWFEIPLWPIDLLVRIGDAFPFLNLPQNHLRAIRLWQGYNMEKASRELTLRPQPFENTVKDALAWFREKGMFR